MPSHIVRPFVTIIFVAANAQPACACGDFFKQVPGVSMALCQRVALQDSGARSVQGRAIVQRDVGNPLAPQRVLVVGALHGDENASASLALHWLDIALAQPRGVHWRFVPALNPDGLLTRPAQRANARGVDLNRNFPTPDWDTLATRYWIQTTRRDPRRWPGPSPLSEPESRFLVDTVARFNPDVVVAIHAPYGVLDFDGPQQPPHRLGRLNLKQVGVFPGSLGNWAGLQHGLAVVTVELAQARRAPSTADTRTMWNDLNTWLTRTLSP